MLCSRVRHHTALCSTGIACTSRGNRHGFAKPVRLKFALGIGMLALIAALTGS